MDQAVELADLIAQVRSELSLAMWSGESKDLQFELGPVELELAVVVEREKKPGGKVRLWVVEGGVDARLGSMTTQRIKLTLHPQLRGALGQRVRVSGDELAGEK